MRSLFRGILAGAALAGAAALAGGAMAQEAPKSIKVGYAIALSGPEAPGAGLTTLPNYRLWIKEVNDAGGLMLKKYGKKVPIEAVELDDTSSPEARQRLIEKLMAVDKVDLVLTPWSTGANLARRHAAINTDTGSHFQEGKAGVGNPCALDRHRARALNCGASLWRFRARQHCHSPNAERCCHQAGETGVPACNRGA